MKIRCHAKRGARNGGDVYVHTPLVPLKEAQVFYVLQVAGVGAGPYDEPHPAPRLLPRAGHEAARRVVEGGANLFEGGK